MCIIVVIPKGEKISPEYSKNCFEGNSDGAGFACCTPDHRIIIKKGFFTYPAFGRAFVEARKQYPDSPFLLHFRIRTSGLRNAENCHPFLIQDRVAFAHNGTLGGKGDKSESDTLQFVKKTLDELPNGWEYNTSIRFLLNEYALREVSKFAILTQEGEYFLYNDKLWVQEGGCYFSNSTFRYSHRYVCSGYDSYGYYGNSYWNNQRQDLCSTRVTNWNQGQRSRIEKDSLTHLYTWWTKRGGRWMKINLKRSSYTPDAYICPSCALALTLKELGKDGKCHTNHCTDPHILKGAQSLETMRYTKMILTNPSLPRWVIDAINRDNERKKNRESLILCPHCGRQVSYDYMELESLCPECYERISPEEMASLHIINDSDEPFDPIDFQLKQIEAQETLDAQAEQSMLEKAWRKIKHTRHPHGRKDQP